MTLILISFFAGTLTILAPCVLPVLPIILGGSILDAEDKKRPYIIIASLSISVIIFSLLLKATTLFISIDPIVWKIFSGGILLFFGLITLFPNIWKSISSKIGFDNSSQKALGKSGQKSGILGSVFVGLSLGPVFSSCSPTYLLILAVVLPAGFIYGLLNLFAYTLGLALMLLLVAFYGQKLIKKTTWASNPNGNFKKVLGIIFIFIGLLIITGTDKRIEAKLLDLGIGNTINFEQNLLEKVDL